MLSLRSTPEVGVVDAAGVVGAAVAPDVTAAGVPMEFPPRESLSLLLPDLSEMSLGGPVCDVTEIFSSSNSMGPT